MLRLFAEEVGIAVGKDKDAVVAVDDAKFSARVTRESRMTEGINVARAHALAGLEARGNRNIAACRRTFRNQRHRFLNGERWGGNRRAWRRLAAFDLRRSDEAALRQQHKKCGKLPLVVAHAQIIGWRNQLDFVTCDVNIPFA